MQNKVYINLMSIPRFKTEADQNKQDIEHDRQVSMMRRIISLASRQKILPKVLEELQIKCGIKRKQKFLKYQSLVKALYGQQGKVPLKYNPQDAMTHRQKFRLKVQKLQNHQLDIDYFDKIKNKQGKLIPLFMGHPLEKINYPTKKQFIIFKDFNENKFKKSYTQMFDDKLQLRQQSLIRQERKKTMQLIRQGNEYQNEPRLPKPKFNSFKKSQSKLKQQISIKKLKLIKLRPMTQGMQLVLNPIPPVNQKYKPRIEKKIIGKMINDISAQILHKKLIQIGSFPSTVSRQLISLTRQSFSRHLKSLYERQIRIVDFLEVKPVLNLQEYTNMCTRLKLMTNQHIIFMTFLFYDFNNDGYICDNDIRRLKTLKQNKKLTLVEEDINLILQFNQRKNTKQKQQLPITQDNLEFSNQKINQNQSKYLELYKLPSITQTTYFNWLRKLSDQQNQKLNNHKNSVLNYQNFEKGQKDEMLTSQNSFNPSVFKFKNSFNNEKLQVRKYLFGVKAKKTYISFDEFRSIYEHKQSKGLYQQRYPKRQQSASVDKSRLLDFSRINRLKTQKGSKNIDIQGQIRKDSKSHSIVGSSRFVNGMHQKSSQMFVYKKDIPRLDRRSAKINYKQQKYKTFLWYDLMQKLGGIKFQGLKYV